MSAWETQQDSGICAGCGMPSDWADCCSNCGNGVTIWAVAA